MKRRVTLAAAVVLVASLAPAAQQQQAAPPPWTLTEAQIREMVQRIRAGRNRHRRRGRTGHASRSACR